MDLILWQPGEKFAVHFLIGDPDQRGEGFFERSPDMVFALKRQKVGKKIKQRPVVRHRDAPKRTAARDSSLPLGSVIMVSA